jgi:hypothetical protein
MVRFTRWPIRPPVVHGSGSGVLIRMVPPWRSSPSMAVIPDSQTVRFPVSVMTSQTIEVRAPIGASDAKCPGRFSAASVGPGVALSAAKGV